MLRDNIAWEAISNNVSTRSNVLCCQKWYTQLTSPMVADSVGIRCSKHIGEHANKSFPEQFEVLSKQYCTDVLEARETYDSKPAVS
ncbi:hypothetical protein I3843_15G104200 [Carya illinoinensis]|nr:hypothetical protein I3843_15G104200 [Carya illinoinensis]